MGPEALRYIQDLFEHGFSHKEINVTPSRKSTRVYLENKSHCCLLYKLGKLLNLQILFEWINV